MKTKQLSPEQCQLLERLSLPENLKRLEKMGGSVEDLKRLLIRIKHHDCWVWSNGFTVNGYGMFSIKRKGILSHRFIYMVCKGIIPKHLEIDHLCRNRLCCNPDHLEAVTRRENLLRSPFTIVSINLKRTHCKRGHPLMVKNYINGLPQRFCRLCKNLTRRKDYVK